MAHLRKTQRREKVERKETVTVVKHPIMCNISLLKFFHKPKITSIWWKNYNRFQWLKNCFVCLIMKKQELEILYLTSTDFRIETLDTVFKWAMGRLGSLMLVLFSFGSYQSFSIETSLSELLTTIKPSR